MKFFAFRWRVRLASVVLGVAVLLGSACGSAEARGTHHHRSATTWSPPPYADIVIEASTGRVLRSTSAAQTRHPASLTKMMTLYLTFKALEEGRLRMDQPLPVSANAARQAPTKLGLRVGRTIRVRDAILGLVTESANDAAVVLAEALGGTESAFAQKMTRTAKTLGMNSTVFRNASGLPNPQQVTTARDMALLGYALVAHYPTYYPVFRQATFAYGEEIHRNHNHLMERYTGMDGIKTGYVRASGFNLVASATRGGTRLIGVVFGGRSAAQRDRTMEAILDSSFANVASQGSSRGTKASSLPLPGKNGTSVLQVAAYQERTARVGGGPSLSGPGAKPAVPTDSSWTVRVGGTYSDAATGRQALEGLRLRPDLRLAAGARPALREVPTGDGGVLYQLVFEGFSPEDAQAVCASMVAYGGRCAAVPPAGSSPRDDVSRVKP